MTHEFTVSRRKVLAGLGTIGVASAGAGLGTTAFFSDEESLDASLEAGKIDLKLDYRATYKPWDRETEFANVGIMDGTDMTYVLSQVPDLRTEDTDVPVSEAEWGDTVIEDYGCDDDTSMLVDGDAGVMFNLADVKPKDEGEFTISMHICDNRAYLWVKAQKGDDLDNSVVEPEASANESFVPDADPQVDGSAGGELDDYMHVRVFFDENCNNIYDEDTDSSGDVPLFEGSLAGFLEAASTGLPLDDVFEDRTEEELDGTENETVDEEGETVVEGTGCYEPGVHCIAVYWYLPGFNVDGGMGFSELDSDVEGAETLADELAAKDLPYEDFDAINVVQTDSVAWTLQFYAIQCRHNMTNDNPFDAAAGDDDQTDAEQIV
jgi:predicted ribosomally synthesized peptide with SipW-like signal peptide